MHLVVDDAGNDVSACGVDFPFGAPAYLARDFFDTSAVYEEIAVENPAPVDQTGVSDQNSLHIECLTGANVRVAGDIPALKKAEG